MVEVLFPPQTSRKSRVPSTKTQTIHTHKKKALGRLSAFSKSAQMPTLPKGFAVSRVYPFFVTLKGNHKESRVVFGFGGGIPQKNSTHKLGLAASLEGSVPYLGLPPAVATLKGGDSFQWRRQALVDFSNDSSNCVKYRFSHMFGRGNPNLAKLRPGMPGCSDSRVAIDKTSRKLASRPSLLAGGGGDKILTSEKHNFSTFWG